MYFKSRDEILASSLMNGGTRGYSDNVLKATRLDRHIFRELRENTPEIKDYERQYRKTLVTVKELIADIFQAFYAISPKLLDDEELSITAKTVNKKILQEVMGQKSYQEKKSVCEGCEMPALAATLCFLAEFMPNLEEIKARLSGGKDRNNAMEKLEQDISDMLDELKRKYADDKTSDKAVTALANKIVSKQGQLADVVKMAERSAETGKSAIAVAIRCACETAFDKAEAVKAAIISWGGDDADMRKSQFNSELLEKVSKSDKLTYIAKFLGRYKEMYANQKKNGYAYGRGEKYDITTGSNISKALTAEMSLLSDKRLIPLFIHKYQSKSLKQYRKREPIFKGKGDMIVCLDESSSTFGENQAWGMAIAMLMLKICRDNNRNFALIHFSDEVKVDTFLAAEKDIHERMLEASETFLKGSTDFDLAINTAIDTADTADFNNADILFITDGVCNISEECEERLKERQKASKFTITGILLDKGFSMDLYIKKFCKKIYRTSELCADEIAVSLIKDEI